MTKLETIRTLVISDGEKTYGATVYRCPERGYLLHDHSDRYFDSLEPIADDSNTSIRDVLGGDMEIVD